MFLKIIPDEIEFLAFFGIEPILFEKENVSYVYKIRDNKGIELEFAFSIVEGWISYILKLNEEIFFSDEIHTISSIRIVKDILGEFLDIDVNVKEHLVKIELRVKPFISIKCCLLSI